MTCCQKRVLSLGSLSQTGLRLSYLPLHEEADRDNLCASLLTWDHASQDYSQGEVRLKLKRRASDDKLLSFTVCGLIFTVLHQFLFFHLLMFIYSYKHVARTTASFQCPSTQGP